MQAVYLDHNATTPVDPRVREAMLPWLGDRHGNPSSVHRFGREAREAVENAREQVAALLGARPPEVVFTASGTEANNAVVLGAAQRTGYRGGLVISAFEHPSVRAAAELVAAGGMEVTRVAPAADGVVAAAAFAGALAPDTRLACLMRANNEVGTLQPVAEVAEACRARGVALLCDAVQAVGKVPVSVADLGADFVTLGGHKFHGPLGIAALWVRPGAELTPLLVGAARSVAAGPRPRTSPVPSGWAPPRRWRRRSSRSGPATSPPCATASRPACGGSPTSSSTAPARRGCPTPPTSRSPGSRARRC